MFSETPQSEKYARRSAERHRALQFRVSVPASNEASKRLARKIQLSIANMIENEIGAGKPVAMSIAESSETTRVTPYRAASAAPGCGAWWNF